MADCPLNEWPCARLVEAEAKLAAAFDCAGCIHLKRQMEGDARISSLEAELDDLKEKERTWVKESHPMLKAALAKLEAELERLKAFACQRKCLRRAMQPALPPKCETCYRIMPETARPARRRKA